MIFLSFAADFSFGRAIRHLFATGTKKHSDQLKDALLERYGGEDVRLYHNGRTALSEAIKSLVPHGSKVIINGLTCYAVPQSVKSAGCEPIYVDINRNDFNFDIDVLTKVVEADKNISAIIIQNHLGLPADIVAIEKLAKKYDLIVIEDLAHCAGSHYADGREVGTVGSATALSFGKGKSLDTTEGGALVLRHAKIQQTLKSQKVTNLSTRTRDRIYPILGWKIRKTYRIGLGKAIAALAFKTKMIVRSAEGAINPTIRPTHWQAKLALRQLGKLDEVAKHRAKFALSYNFPKNASILRIPFLINNRDEVLKKLRSKGIFLDDSWYEVPVSPKRYYKKADFPEEACPVAVSVADKMINLPLLPKKQLKFALEIIKPEEVKSDK